VALPTCSLVHLNGCQVLHLLVLVPRLCCLAFMLTVMLYSAIALKWTPLM